MEATANNPAQTVSYAPPGAEHDVYVYRVSVETAAFTGVVINELMAWLVAPCRGMCVAPLRSEALRPQGGG